MTIDQWIQENRGTAPEEWKLEDVSRAALDLIRMTTKFCYTERPNPSTLIQDPYFKDYDQPLHEISDRGFTYLEDPTVFLGTEFRRLHELVKRKSARCDDGV